MKLVWSKSNLPVSLLIRLITGEDCSHFAFVFESKASGLMFESNLLGTHPTFYATALKSHTVVHSIDVPLSADDEDALWDEVVQKYDDKGYDFAGAIYLGLCVLRKRIFGIPLPEINKWGSKDKYFCDEVYQCLEILPQFPQIPVGNGMETPHMVYEKLKSLV